MKNYDKILKSIGLDNNEAKVYLESIKLGTTQASVIGKKLGIPRTTARYACENLVSKDLMIKTKKGNSMLFTAEPPQKIKNLVEIQKNKLDENAAKINQIMPDLIGFYNPYTKLPKVTFYEGEEGIKKVLDNSLTAKETIDGFVDVKSILKYIPKTNEEYIKKRIDLEIKRRSIYENTEETKQFINEQYPVKGYNEIKYTKTNKFNTHISFMIYDGKISYITLKENNLFGVIIENDNIYNFHKNIFEFMWQNL